LIQGQRDSVKQDLILPIDMKFIRWVEVARSTLPAKQFIIIKISNELSLKNSKI
jgi:hypothetical protein